MTRDRDRANWESRRACYDPDLMWDLARVFGTIGSVYACEHARRTSAMRHFAFVFGAIGRLYAIKRGLDYDLRDAKRARPDIVVPREVFDAVMRGWYLALGMDGAAAMHA